jgi:hypothetical protein
LGKQREKEWRWWRITESTHFNSLLATRVARFAGVGDCYQGVMVMGEDERSTKINTDRNEPV